MAENNFAFIDSNNLYQGLTKDIFKNNKKLYSGWKLDYKRFMVYLKDKYMIEKAFLFIGFIPDNLNMYRRFQEYGYICIFKPTLELKNEKIKGNVDAELVLHSMIEYDNYDKALIVSGDGDFYCLAKYLINSKKLKIILTPNKYNYSCLLDRLSSSDNNILSFVADLQNKLEKKVNKKALLRTNPLENFFVVIMTIYYIIYN